MFWRPPYPMFFERVKALLRLVRRGLPIHPRDMSANDYEAITGQKLEPVVYRVKQRKKPKSQQESPPVEPWWQKHADGKEPWPLPIQPTNKAPTQNPEKHNLSKFFANPFVQGVGVIIALALTLSGKFDQSGTVVLIVAAAIIGAIGIWTHSKRKSIALMLIVFYILALCGFGKYLTAKPPESSMQNTPQSSSPQSHQAPEAQQQASSTSDLPPLKRQRTKPATSSVAPPKEKPPTLSDFFKNDFPGVVSLSDKGFDLKDSTGQVGAHVDWKLLLDFSGKSEFVAFYVPAVRDEVPVCVALIDVIRPTIDRVAQNLDASGGFAGESTSLHDLTFSGRVFIYHEWPLSNKQKADIVEAYSAKGLDVQFRGMDYLGEKLIAWHQQHGVKTVH